MPYIELGLLVFQLYRLVNAMPYTEFSSTVISSYPNEDVRDGYIEDIYFFEVNTKYISSNVLKISGISLLLQELKYFWYLLKKSKFSFYFFHKGEKLYFFHGHFSLILLGSARLVGIILGANSLHLENGLQCHFNEWIKRNLWFKKAT